MGFSIMAAKDVTHAMSMVMVMVKVDNHHHHLETGGGR